jgi:cell wall-associated NlpC family hydrolase
VPTLEAWLRAEGRWMEDDAQPGDLAIFNWDGGIADHVGIVIRPLTGDRFATVEGNTGTGSDSDGGEVMRRERRLAQAAGFGRL